MEESGLKRAQRIWQYRRRLRGLLLRGVGKEDLAVAAMEVVHPGMGCEVGVAIPTNPDRSPG
jgi:hypothetical protein